MVLVSCMMLTDVVFLFPVLAAYCATWICRFIDFIKLGKLCAVISTNVFYFLSSLCFGDSNYTYWGCAMLTDALLFVITMFFLYGSFFIVSSTVFKFTNLSSPVAHSPGVFFTSHIVVFIPRSSVGVFTIIT